VPDGTYLIEFRDCNPNPIYLDQWWFNSPGPAGATQLKVGGALTLAQLQVDASMKAGAIVTGIVSGADTGAPLAGICVEASRAGTATKRAITDSNGGYTLALSDGDWGVHFEDCRSQPIYLPTGAMAHIDGVQSRTVALNVSMQRGGTISGHVTDDVTGMPIANICVSGPGPKSALTDATGSYTVTDVPTGRFWMTFSDCAGTRPGYLYAHEYYHHAATYQDATEIAVNAPSNTVVDETLIRSGSISGTITDAATGAPLSSIVVRAWQNGAITGDGAVSQSDGTYVLDGLLPGETYKIEFFQGANAYVTQWWNDQATQDQAQTVSVTSDNTTIGINAAMVAQ
jgi:hypothetical protein